MNNTKLLKMLGTASPTIVQTLEKAKCNLADLDHDTIDTLLLAIQIERSQVVLDELIRRAEQPSTAAPTRNLHTDDCISLPRSVRPNFE